MTKIIGSPLGLGRDFHFIVIGLLTMMLLDTAPSVGQAQNPDKSPSHSENATIPVFDVVSIRQHRSVDVDVSFQTPEDGVSMSNIPMKMLLHEAFGMENDRIFGAPDWVKTTRYDIEAKVAAPDIPALEKLTTEQRRLMICELLQDRFGLKFHHEQKEIPVYALVIAKGGSKLKQSSGLDDHGNKVPSSMHFYGNATLESRGTALSFLLDLLSHELNRSVLDMTGLTGNFDYTLQWTPEDNAASMGLEPKDHRPRSNQEGPTLFTALNEQLGLKLEARKMPGDVIIVDNLDQPSAN